MAVSKSGEWSEIEVKRSLSRMEKSSIINKTGIAVLLPGSTKAEIEECEEIGFKNIVGFERNKDICNKLEKYYKDSIIMYHGNIEDKYKDFITDIEDSEISYVHLDLMGLITKDLYTKSKSFTKNLSDESRFRFTTLRYPRGRGSITHPTILTKNLAYEVFLPECNKSGVNSFKLNSVIKIIDSYFANIKNKTTNSGLKAGTDYNSDYASVQAAMFVGLMNHYNYNKNTFKYSIIESTKYNYVNNSSSMPMFTTWFDFKRKSIESVIFYTQLCDYILKETKQWQ